jgi:hypothetical protein
LSAKHSPERIGKTGRGTSSMGRANCLPAMTLCERMLK